jgi:hypothetical protein
LPRQASQVPSASDSAVSSFVQNGMLVQTQVRRSQMCLMAVAVTLYLHTQRVTSPYVRVTCTCMRSGETVAAPLLTMRLSAALAQLRALVLLNQ